MADRVFWAGLADPKQAAGAIAWRGSTFMYLERAPVSWMTEAEIACGVRLETFDPATDLAKWERGRVFCAAYELRWERLDDVYQATLIGDVQPVGSFALAPDLDLSHARIQPRSYFLWGLRVENSDLAVVGVTREGPGEPYLEMRIPRLLRYPVAGAKRRTALTACEYIDPQTGRVLHYRFTGVEEC